MRLLVVGQPASGLFVLAGLLQRIYDLSDLNNSTRGIPGNEVELIRYIENGRFEDDAILTSHYPAAEALIQACESIDCHILCAVKHPYATFEAVYLNANSNNGIPLGPSAELLRDVPMESDGSRRFIEDHFARQLALTGGWIGSKKATIVPFEKLTSEPEQTLSEIGSRIGQADQKRIREAIDERFPGTAGPASASPLSDSRLPDNIRCALNQVIPEPFKRLGYEKEGCTPEETMNRRLQGFGRFLERCTDKQRVFLVGHGKSGTTWLHMLFFHHPNAAVVAERRLIEHPDENVALFDLFLDDASFESWFDHSSFGIRTPEQKAVRFEISRLLSDYLAYRTIAMRRTTKGFGRKEPITHFSEKIALNSGEDALLTMRTLKKIYPAAKIIHIVRDPRDVAVSAMFHSYRNFKENSQQNWLTGFVEAALSDQTPGIVQKRMAASYFREFAISWSRIVSAFHDQGTREYATNYQLLRYEGLLQEPVAEVTRLFEFTGLDASEGIVRTVVDNASFKRLSQGRASGEQDSGSFFRKGISGDWRNYLSESESRKLYQAAHQLMERFGYL